MEPKNIPLVTHTSDKYFYNAPLPQPPTPKQELKNKPVITQQSDVRPKDIKARYSMGVPPFPILEEQPSTSGRDSTEDVPRPVVPMRSNQSAKKADSKRLSLLEKVTQGL